MNKSFIDAFARAAHKPGPELAEAALLIARIEYPNLDIAPYLERFERLGEHARHRMASLEVAAPPAVASDAPPRPHEVRHAAQEQIRILNDYLFEELKFSGNRDHYDDPRNSFLNEVLDRRTGIPISLSVVYIEVARRAGMQLEGVNFPGHFLVRHPMTQVLWMPDLIIDPFNEGAILSEAECRQRLQEHLGDEAALDPKLLETATKPQMLVRMLINLKGLYVRMRSFPQARDITDLLLAINPSGLTELRDRGLIAYHLNDFPSALRDLESYLRQASTLGEDADRSEQRQLWEHVKTLRKRVAELN